MIRLFCNLKKNKTKRTGMGDVWEGKTRLVMGMKMQGTMMLKMMKMRVICDDEGRGGRKNCACILGDPRKDQDEEHHRKAEKDTWSPNWAGRFIFPSCYAASTPGEHIICVGHPRKQATCLHLLSLVCRQQSHGIWLVTSPWSWASTGACSAENFLGLSFPIVHPTGLTCG